MNDKLAGAQLNALCFNTRLLKPDGVFVEEDIHLVDMNAHNERYKCKYKLVLATTVSLC